MFELNIAKILLIITDLLININTEFERKNMAEKSLLEFSQIWTSITSYNPTENKPKFSRANLAEVTRVDLAEIVSALIQHQFRNQYCKYTDHG